VPPYVGLVGFHWVFFNDGFALRLVPAACVRSPVSLYHTVISHQVGSCDLQFQYVQCPGLSEEDRKYVFTPPSTGHENNEATSVGFLFWSCTYYVGHCPLHVIIHSHLQDRLLRDFSFVLRGAQNPHLPESFLDDGGVLCGLLTLFLPDQSTILNLKRE